MQLLFAQHKDILRIFLLGHFEGHCSSTWRPRLPRVGYFFFLPFFCNSSFDFALFISFHETRTFFFFASVAAWIRVKRLPPCVTARIATSCVQKRHAVVWDAGTTKGFQMSRILSCVAEPHDLLCSHFLCSAVICRLASAERFLLCVYQPIPTDF